MGAGAEREPRWAGLEAWLGRETVGLRRRRRRRRKSLGCVGWWKETKSLVLNPTWRSKLGVRRRKHHQDARCTGVASPKPKTCSIIHFPEFTAIFFFLDDTTSNQIDCHHCDFADHISGKKMFACCLWALNLDFQKYTNFLCQ